jgi:tripartite-type tricarboxylate transporter receptor subunit TctC
VTTATRSDVLPNIPTLSEFVPGYEMTDFFGLGAPKNTPVEIVDRLNKEINAALADPKIKERFADLALPCFRARPPTSASSSLTKRKNGAR